MTAALFICVHNAGRRQMAAAIFNPLAQRLDLPVSASSAGTEPADRVHPNVVPVMEEWRLPDPAGRGLDATREIRDAITRKVLGLLQEMLETTTERVRAN